MQNVMWARITVAELELACARHRRKNAVQRDAHHDLGHHERDEDQRRVAGAAAELEAGERERGERADDRRDERRDERDLQRVAERLQHVGVVDAGRGTTASRSRSSRCRSAPC